jgi:sulfoxide reductase heme-binding subunit YedZ
MMALIFLTLSLAVTPLRKLTGRNYWSHFRRMLGLFAFLYGVLHLTTYFVFIRSIIPSVIIKDVIDHPYIALGMASLILMTPLAITSTNAAVKRMGAKNWKRLHRLAYAAGVAGVIHYWMLVKADIRIPVAFAITLAALLIVRLIGAKRKPTLAAPRSA